MIAMMIVSFTPNSASTRAAKNYGVIVRVTEYASRDEAARVIVVLAVIAQMKRAAGEEWRRHLAVANR